MPYLFRYHARARAIRCDEDHVALRRYGNWGVYFYDFWSGAHMRSVTDRLLDDTNTHFAQVICAELAHMQIDTHTIDSVPRSRLKTFASH